MRNTRWLKLMVTLAALGLITAAGSAQAANVPARSTSSLALGYCSPASQPVAGNILSSKLSAGELCSEAGPAHSPTAGGWRMAGPADGRNTSSPISFVALAATWGDAGANRR